MSVEENKAVVRRYLEEVFHNGNLEVIDECISEDWVYHGPEGFKTIGPEGFRQMVLMWRTAFPDIHYNIEEMIGEGDRLVVRCTMTATFKGPLMGIPPTGKRIGIPIVYFYRFKDGRELEATPFLDLHSFYAQMGIDPPG